MQKKFPRAEQTSLVDKNNASPSPGQLLNAPPIYILDDSFSALDFKTDAALRRAFKEQAADSTLLIVTQRVSTIKNAEQIIVLDEGRIVGRGTHHELMKNCETYREIATSQLTQEELA